MSRSRLNLIPGTALKCYIDRAFRAAAPRPALALPSHRYEPLSTKHRPSLSYDAYGRPIPSAKRRKLVRRPARSETRRVTAVAQLSREDRDKLGPCLFVTYSLPRATEQYRFMIRDVFTSCVRASTRKGLSCWGEALIQCSRVISPANDDIIISPRLLASNVKRIDGHPPDWPQIRVDGFVRKGRPGIDLSLPHAFRVHSGGLHEGADTSIIRLDRVSLRGWVDETRLEQGHEARDFDIIEEAAFLTDMARTISSRVYKAMSFQTVREALSTIAEAMLRVLEFRSSAIVLQRVCLMSTDSASASATTRLTIANWKAQASSEVEDESRKEVEITFEDQNTDKVDQASDQKLVDESPEDLGDGTVLATDAPFGTTHPSREMSEPYPSKSGDNAQLPDHDSVAAHAHLIHQHALTPDDFSSREKPYLDLPLHHNPLVSRTENIIKLSCGLFHSKRIEHHLTFPKLRFALFWLPEQWSTVAEMSLFDVAQIIEDHLITRTEDNITSWSEATKAISDILPGSPKVRIEFTIKEHDRHKVRSFISLRENGTACISPAVLIKDVRPGLLMKMPAQGLRVKVSLYGTLIASEGMTRPACSASQSIVDSLDLVVRTILNDPNCKDIQHASQLIGNRFVWDPMLCAGLVALDSAHAYVRIHEKSSGGYLSIAAADVSRNSGDDAILVALGSNVGDRVSSIEAALRVLDGNEKIKLLQTSPLYETEPMYVEDQKRFLNGVCQIETQLPPIQLLDTLQAVETDLGRVKLIDKGPRNIDLDIIAYGQRIIESDRLTVPHRLMLERGFVLRPLCDLYKHFTPPSSRSTASDHLSNLPPSSTAMHPLTPLAPGLDLYALDPVRKTMVMSILNVTPDSFSDGGVYQPADIEALKTTVAAHIAAGAKIIDIGGQSSRPNAPDVTPDEELARVLPAIEAVKSLPEAGNVAISVDTYRAAVADAAINAGAHIINDISAGRLDPEMLPTIARLGCTYIMMHMRGTPATMQNEENTSYPDGLIDTISKELSERLRAAQEAGIFRWRIVLDPGIGFAKTTQQNLEILGNFKRLRHTPALRTYPWLVGSSRKGFIGEITGVDNAADRVSGTAATVTAAIQGGAEIVRVHDVEEMMRVVKMTDAMYRTEQADVTA